jgi:hypothetical protein
MRSGRRGARELTEPQLMASAPPPSVSPVPVASVSVPGFPVSITRFSLPWSWAHTLVASACFYCRELPVIGRFCEYSSSFSTSNVKSPGTPSVYVDRFPHLAPPVPSIHLARGTIARGSIDVPAVAGASPLFACSPGGGRDPSA